MVLAFVFAVVSLAACSCANRVEPSPAASVDHVTQQATALLSRYGFHGAGPETAVSVKLGKAHTQPFTLYAWASESIGLDMSGLAGRRVELLSIPLREKSQSDDGDIDALFFIDDETVCGACLSFHGYYPDVGSLSDRSNLMPPGLSPERLDFSGVRSVEVIGPWTGSEWQERVTLSEPTEREILLGLLAASRPRSGERCGVQGDEEYMIILTFAEGAVVRARLVAPQNGAMFLAFDPDMFTEWHFVPAEGLKDRVESALGM